MKRRCEVVIDGNPLTLTYTDTGQGAVVVFLHALGRSSADWQDVIADLSRSFRCIAVDLPGHGDSSHAGQYSFELLTRSTQRLIDDLDVDSFAIVAHSMGATAAWILAPGLGLRLWALVVEDTGVPSGRVAYPEVPPTPPDAVGYDWEACRQIVSELNRPDPRWHERLAEIVAPVLVIAGSADDEDINATLEELAQADVVTIPVGHWIHQDALERFAATTHEFLVRCQQSS